MTSVEGRAGIILQSISLQLAEFGFSCRGSSNSFFRTRRDCVFDIISLLLDYGGDGQQFLGTLNVGVGYIDADFVARNPKCALTWNIGYLMSGRKWKEWDLTDPSRKATLADMVQCLDKFAIPWLERFSTAGDVRREQSRNQPRGFSNLLRQARRRTAAG